MRQDKTHGTGRLILPMEKSPFYYKLEGKFVDGQPKGIMFVNSPGEASYEEEY